MIGQPLPRREDGRLITGRGQYTDDMDLPGQTWAAFVRSPHAHARIVAIETAAASGMPGVIAVLTGRDYADDGHRGIDHIPNPVDAVDARAKAFTRSSTGRIYERRQWPLAIDKVRHVGEALVMVVAETVHQARDAAEAVAIDYEVLPAVVRADDALAEGAPQLYDDLPRNLCFETELGDRAAVDAAFAGAACVVRREFRNSRIVNCQMEPRSALGHYDAAQDRWLLVAGSQGVNRQHMMLTDALGMAPERLRVVSPDVGGGFGPRYALNMEPVAVLWGARRVGRPVKWTSDRSEAFVSDYQGRDLLIRAAVAFDAQGRILALDNHLAGNVGAHAVSYVPMSNSSRVTTSVYDVPAVAVKISAAMSNTVPTGPYRGAGRPEAMHAIERVLDVAARELGIDRIEIRRRNLIPRHTLPRLSPMGLPYDAGDFQANMDRVLQLADWAGFARRREASAARGKLRGIGLANYIESPVGAPRERIELEMRPDGQLDIVSGTQSTGQGHETSFLQVLAEHLGLPPERMHLRTGDTEFVKVGGGTHSDRSMRLAGTLLVEASARLLERSRLVAADLAKADPQRLQRHGDGFVLKRKWWFDRVLSWADLARHVAQHGLPDDRACKRLAVVAEFFGRMPAYPTGAAVCELEVDVDTGEVELLRYAAVDDVGRAINPLILEGQIHGGLAQGLGQALGEHYAIDGKGQVLAGSFMDYRLPRAGLLPPLTIELTNDPTHGNPLGVKGGGESGITPATATTFNALADALSAHTREEIPMPATALALWELIRKSQELRHA
ncbi:xanthine dehydrogenase family protein molybdopterin-binding subunit [Variovorax davisae]|uniref:xanthine dehydrogenase family protein molybdopterin-binding subunit n=1 Tax=Variovorax davisae TaxID=3053515 RepID=UPI0025780A80|nr:xanthine dehydrogenase family protein molybdopterin-binding subunit [Variovorax sp. J22P271]